jgi:Na+-transporting methylmalonyl-CoA/oxaloacetate decarboxylase gamma subunit
MNTELISALKLMGMGMAAIFFVIIIIYLVVQLMLRISRGKADNPDAAKPL